MAKRNLAAILWFVAGWWAGELIVPLMSLPYLLAFVPGIALAAFVRWDPYHLFWSSSTPPVRRVRPINELADELDGNAAKRAEADGDRAGI